MPCRASGAACGSRHAGDGELSGAVTGGFGFLQRMALFYGALFLVYGIHVPFMSLWLDFKGLSAAEIAIATAAPQFLRLAVTPLVGAYADATGRHRRLIAALAWAALVVTLVMSQSRGFVALLALATALQVLVSTIMPLTETIALSGARLAGLDYGRMRLWGSLTFIVATFAAGPVIDAAGAGSVVWLIAVGLVATVACGALLPQPVAGSPAVSEAGQRAPSADLATEGLRLLRTPLFLLFLFAASAAMGSHAMLYTFGALIWQGQAISTTWIGILWAIGVICEIALFAWSGWFMRTVGVKGALVLGLAGSVVRWAALAFDPPLWLLVVLSPLHGLGYGAAHLGAMHFIAEAVPRRAAGTAQAMYSAVAAGAAQGAATLAAGAIYRAYGSYGYLAMAALALAGLAAALVVARGWDGGRLWCDDDERAAASAP